MFQPEIQQENIVNEQVDLFIDLFIYSLIYLLLFKSLDTDCCGIILDNCCPVSAAFPKGITGFQSAGTSPNRQDKKRQF